MPPELKQLRAATGKEEESEAESDDKDEDKGKAEEPEYATQEDRRNAFKDLLEEKKIKPTMKWEEALKLIQDDRRLNALTRAGERKQVFAEYVAQRKKREKEEEREKKKHAKDDFVAAVKSWEDLKVTTRYRDV